MSQPQLRARLQTLQNKPENQYCCDCSEKNPSWASILVPPPGCDQQLGVFCCYQCSGAHRKMGTQVCFVRSIGLDEWSESEIMAMELGGNKVVNSIYEGKLSFDTPRPNASSGLPFREIFIHDKYAERTFFNPLALKGLINRSKKPISLTLIKKSTSDTSTRSMANKSNSNTTTTMKVGSSHDPFDAEFLSPAASSKGSAAAAAGPPSRRRQGGRRNSNDCSTPPPPPSKSPPKPKSMKHFGKATTPDNNHESFVGNHDFGDFSGGGMMLEDDNFTSFGENDFGVEQDSSWWEPTTPTTTTSEDSKKKDKPTYSVPLGGGGSTTSRSSTSRRDPSRSSSCQGKSPHRVRSSSSERPIRSNSSSDRPMRPKSISERPIRNNSSSTGERSKSSSKISPGSSTSPGISFRKKGKKKDALGGSLESSSHSRDSKSPGPPPGGRQRPSVGGQSDSAPKLVRRQLSTRFLDGDEGPPLKGPRSRRHLNDDDTVTTTTTASSSSSKDGSGGCEDAAQPPDSSDQQRKPRKTRGSRVLSSSNHSSVSNVDDLAEEQTTERQTTREREQRRGSGDNTRMRARSTGRRGMEPSSRKPRSGRKLGLSNSNNSMDNDDDLPEPSSRKQRSGRKLSLSNSNNSMDNDDDLPPPDGAEKSSSKPHHRRNLSSGQQQFPKSLQTLPSKNNADNTDEKSVATVSSDASNSSNEQQDKSTTKPKSSGNLLASLYGGGGGAGAAVATEAPVSRRRLLKGQGGLV